MSSTGAKLWKKIGNESNKKQINDQKLQNMTIFNNKVQKQPNQQIQCAAPDEKCQANSFDQLQISQIQQPHFHQPVEDKKFKVHHHITFDNLQKMLYDIEDNNDHYRIHPIHSTGQQILKNSQVKQIKNKYLLGCKMFKNILGHLKNQIKLLQDNLHKEVAQSKIIQEQFINKFQKISRDVGMKIMLQKQQNQMGNQKIRELNLKIQQKTINQLRLKSCLLQNDNKIRDFIYMQKNQRDKFFKQLQLINNQKSILTKQNFQLTQKILQLEATNKIFTQKYRQSKLQKMRTSILQRIHSGCSSESPLKKLKNEKISLKSINQNQDNFEPLKSQTSKRINYQSVADSGLWELNIDYQQKRNKFIQNVEQYRPKQNLFRQGIASNDQLFSSSKNRLKYSNFEVKTNSINQNHRKASQIQSHSNIIFEQHYHKSQPQSPQKLKHKGSSTIENRMKNSSFTKVGEKLSRIKQQIQGQIRNLKSSISTNT